MRKKDTLAKSLVYWKWLFLFNKVSYLLIKKKKKKKTLNNLPWFLLFQLCFRVGGKQILMVIYCVAGLQGNRCNACVPNRRHRWDCQPFYPARWGLKAHYLPQSVGLTCFTSWTSSHQEIMFDKQLATMEFVGSIFSELPKKKKKKESKFCIKWLTWA